MRTMGALVAAIFLAACSGSTTRAADVYPYCSPTLGPLPPTGSLPSGAGPCPPPGYSTGTCILVQGDSSSDAGHCSVDDAGVCLPLMWTCDVNN